MNDETTTSRTDDGEPTIVPSGLTPGDATKLDDEIGRAGSQAYGGLAGDDRDPDDETQ